MHCAWLLRVLFLWPCLQKLGEQLRPAGVNAANPVFCLEPHGFMPRQMTTYFRVAYVCRCVCMCACVCACVCAVSCTCCGTVIMLLYLVGCVRRTRRYLTALSLSCLGCVVRPLLCLRVRA